MYNLHIGWVGYVGTVSHVSCHLSGGVDPGHQGLVFYITTEDQHPV